MVNVVGNFIFLEQSLNLSKATWRMNVSTGLTLFEEQAKWVLRSPTQFDSRSQNRFCLYLDPPIGAFSPKSCFSFSEKFISCSAIRLFCSTLDLEGNAHFQSILQFPFLQQICEHCFDLFSFIYNWSFYGFTNMGSLKTRHVNKPDICVRTKLCRIPEDPFRTHFE